MYRTGFEYDTLDQLIYSIYIDYEVYSFPIDEKELCQKMGVFLVPYSDISADNSDELLKKKSQLSFFVRESKENPPTIYYNDKFSSEGAIRLSVFHELKHYVCEDINDDDDDLADYFGRQFMCPTAYLLYKGIFTPAEICLFCGASYKAANNASSNIRNRLKKYGYALKSYEKEYISLIEPELIAAKENLAKGGDIL